MSTPTRSNVNPLHSSPRHSPPTCAEPHPPPKPPLIFLASSPSPSPSLTPIPSDESYSPSRPGSPSQPVTEHEDLPNPRHSALLAPVRGLRTLARVCAGGGAVGNAAAQRRRRLNGDPDIDGELGGSRGRDSAGWRGARAAEGGHRVQVLVGGRVSPAFSYSSGRMSGEWAERPSLEETRSNGGSCEGYSLESEASPAPEEFRWPPPGEESGEPGERVAPFATEVSIKGWQVVGGKSWDDSAKIGAYVVYEIEIALRSGTTVLIMRRYTEFVRLRDALCKAYPHLRGTIPTLPGKNHMHKLSPEFLGDRRPRLQRFLRTVALHPEMGQGDGVLSQWVLGSGPSAPHNGTRLGLKLSDLLRRREA